MIILTNRRFVLVSHVNEPRFNMDKGTYYEWYGDKTPLFSDKHAPIMFDTREAAEQVLHDIHSQYDDDEVKPDIRIEERLVAPEPLTAGEQVVMDGLEELAEYIDADENRPDMHGCSGEQARLLGELRRKDNAYFLYSKSGEFVAPPPEPLTNDESALLAACDMLGDHINEGDEHFDIINDHLIRLTEKQETHHNYYADKGRQDNDKTI